MARIIENEIGRRMIKVNTDDIISIVREYQKIVSNAQSAKEIREQLNKSHFFLPEEV